MWWLALGLAWAQPTEVDPHDVDRYAQQADRLLEGPAGCWELVGEAKWDWDAGRLGANRGSAVFAGRMTDGVWGEFYVRSLGQIVRGRGKNASPTRHYANDLRFIPMVGAIDGATIRVRSGESTEVHVEGGASPDPSNVVRGLLDALSGPVDVSWVEWDAEAGGANLRRAVPLGERRGAPEAEVITFFPEGHALPTALDVVFPERFYRGVLPRIKIEDAAVQVRGRISQGEVFPTMETFRFTLGILGTTVEGAQTLIYKSAVPCTGSEPLALPAQPVHPSPERG